MKTSFRQPSAEPAGLSVHVKMLVSDLSSGAALGYLVLDPVTGAMIEDGGRAGLPGGADGAVHGEIVVELPEEDGWYRVLISPVEEGVAWLYQQGSDALVMDVEVKAGAAHIIELRNTCLLYTSPSPRDCS